MDPFDPIPLPGSVYYVYNLTNKKSTLHITNLYTSNEINNSFYFIIFISLGVDPWAPDPSDQFNKPEWVTKQCMDWLARKKKKR